MIVLTSPYVACLLGLAAGALLLVSSQGAYDLIDPDRHAFSLAIVAGSTFLRIVAAASLIAAWFVWVRPAFVPFALGMAAGFLLALNIVMVRQAGWRRLLRKGGW